MAENIDVLFINPGDHKAVYQGLGEELAAIEPPVFAGLYASYLLRRGRSVAIYDVPARRQSAEVAVAEIAANYNPKLVVLVVYGVQPSASTQNMPSAGRIAQLLKSASPNFPIMMIGTHPAALPKRTIMEEKVDFVCDLEGPSTIAATLDALDANLTRYDDVPSLWWRQGQLIVPPRRAAPLIQDLGQEMPGVAWELIDMAAYRAHNWHCFDNIKARAPYAAIHTSLGCPYKCNFCCINAPFGKPSYRMWEPETVVREIDLLVERYGVRNIKIVDEMFVLNKRHVLGICDALIERGHDLNIWAYARIDTIKDEMLDKIRRAGITWLALGIESASAYVRDGADKGDFSDGDIESIVKLVRDHGINVGANYIFGLPDDTRETMQKTLDLALNLNTEWANFYCAMAYPGSKLYGFAKSNNWALPDDPDGPGWIGYSQHAYESKPLRTETLGYTEVLDFRDDAFNRYFRNPDYLSMIGTRFGDEAVGHIATMTGHDMRRKHRDQSV